MFASIEECCDALLNDNVAAIPTETVYGLAANALSEDAVKKIYALKGRPSQNPLIVHIPDSSAAKKIAEPNDLFIKLTERYWPGPLTLVLDSKPLVPFITRGGLDSVALRSPKCKIFRKCLKRTDLLLAAPSANLSNRISPTSAEHVKENFGLKSVHILDGGSTSIGIESTILDIREEVPKLLRHGPIGKSELELFIGMPISSQIDYKENNQKSPGMSAFHYSPITPLTVYKNLQDLEASLPDSNATVILPSKMNTETDMSSEIIYLSGDGNINEISKNLFSSFHIADKCNTSEIKCILLDEKSDFACAVNDRILRAGSFKGS